MKLPPHKPELLSHPRQRAEDRIGTAIPCARRASDAAVRRKLRELELTQAALELRNSELLELHQTRNDVEAALARYTDLYDYAPMGYFTIDRSGLLCEVNLNGASLIGLDRPALTGRMLRSFVSARYRPRFDEFVGRVFNGRAKLSCELEFINARKRPFFAHVEANADDLGQKCFLVVKDMTANKIVDDAVHRALQELETRVNERTAELLMANEQLKSEIAERKRTEQALEDTKHMLRRLAAHQDRIKEEERKRIAREIHDDLGQNLLALRIDASMLHARTAGGHSRLHRKVADALNHIDLTMKSVRSIINNLRPDVLDLGLPAAFAWQVAEFRRRSRIDCKLVVDESDFANGLDEDLAAALFRILQESLNNVVQHAQATEVLIELHQAGGRLSMTIADNGVGMMASRRRSSQSFGLIGIRERVERLGGTLDINGSDGSGTTLSVSIPLQGNVAQMAPWNGATLHDLG
jgi:PAS domain S-box-containing protein